MTQTHFSIIVAFLTGIVGPIVVMLVREWLDRRKKKLDPIHDELKAATNIVDKLEHLIRTMRCDRAWIIQFHNGGHYYPTGKSIQKYSMFYEVVSKDTDSVQGYYQNIPVSLFSKMLKDVLQNGHIEITDFNDPKIQNYGMQHIALEMDIKSQYVFGIYNNHDRLIGCLGVDFTKRNTKLTSVEMTDLQVDAAVIGGIIHNHIKD